jgi:tRNA (mo5U34)-methyltransferase
MANTLVFDQQESLRVNEARMAALRPVLKEVATALGDLRNVLDIGCGVGYFSKFLDELGFKVVGMDGRAENIVEASRRLPGIDFRVADVEDPQFCPNRQFDFVLCFGLLYHLENPLRALRNLSTVARQALFLESLSIPDSLPFLLLTREADSEDQSLTTVAFYPSEACLAQMCHAAGFEAVYRFRKMPEHEQFRASFFRRRRRTMLVASHIPLDVPSLVPIHASIRPFDPWARAYDLVGKLRARRRRKNIGATQ